MSSFEFTLILAICRKYFICSIVGVIHLQLLTVWREYSAVKAYKHTQISQQINEAQLQLNQGIFIVVDYIYCIIANFGT